jgi:hypothetical protein
MELIIMATITIEIYVDQNGNSKVTANEYEAFDDLDCNLGADAPIRKVTIVAEVPEPGSQTITVEAMPEITQPATIKIFPDGGSS